MISNISATMAVATTATSTSILLGFLEILTHENEFSHKLLELTNWIREDRYFHTIIYMRHEDKQESDYANAYNTDKIIKYLMTEGTVPIMNLQGNTSYYLWYRYNRRHMAIAHLNGDEVEDQELLTNLWFTLKRNLLTRMILVVGTDETEEYIENLLKFCFENKVINVLVIRESLRIGNTVYSMKAFPEFEIKKRKMPDKKPKVIYIDQVKNLEGYPISLLMTTYSSRSYVMRVENGTFILGGFVGHFFSEFARKHNATLTFPNYELFDDSMSINDMDAFVENGTYDASTDLSINVYINYIVYTKTYDYLDWCMMVPIEKPVPTYEFYVIIFDTTSLVMFILTFLLFSLVVGGTYLIRRQPILYQELIFNINILNGLLGQSFKAEKQFAGVRSLIFILICLAGIVFNTSYVTYLQTFKARPPRSNVINSMEDIRKSSMPIGVYEEEYALYKAIDVDNEFSHNLKVFSSYAEYFSLRNSFDMRYIFPVASPQWTLYEQQQKFFTKPRFRLTNICLIKMFGMQIPLAPNSPYVESMNTLIGQVNQAGLVTYWKSLAFLEGLQLKRISLVDKSSIAIFEPMKLEDMKLLMFLFVFIILILCICFVIEIYWPHRGEYIRNSLRFMKKLYKRYLKHN